MLLYFFTDTTSPKNKCTQDKNMSIPNSLKKYLFFTAGFLCVGLGILGILLPLLPTTPFLLAALFFFAGSSPKFHRWLLRWSFLRQFWQNYHSGCGVPVKTKVFSLIFLWAGLAFSATMKHNLYYWSILLLVGIAVSCHLIMLKNNKKEEGNQ